MKRPAAGSDKASRSAAARWKVAGVCAGFGLGLLVQGWLLGLVLGGWLDARFGCTPWCTLGGVLLSLLISFVELFQVLRALERAEAAEKKQQNEQAD